MQGEHSVTQLDQDSAFEHLIRCIQESRGVDFRGYKRSSLHRRIALRMEHQRIHSVPHYQAFLEAHPEEYVDLLNTVLINTTSFFRDADAWEALRAVVLPRLIDATRGRDKLRFWCIGCASGQEAYSLAMLLCELLGRAEFARRVKIYATDLDEAALSVARRARYMAHEVEDVPEPLLATYFEGSNRYYVVSRDLRNAVIFGSHNIIRDAPISRIDLLVCRNLLIYLEPKTQDVVLSRLHYALTDDGYLFLDKSETQLARSRLFQPVDMKHRLFRKASQERRRVLATPVVLEHALGEADSAPHALLNALVDNIAIGCLVIDNDDILIFANATAFRMLDLIETDVRRSLRTLSVFSRPIELRSHIDEVRQHAHPVRIEHREYHRPPGEAVRLTIDVKPLLTRNGKPFAILISFTDTTRTFALQRELAAAKDALDATVEELQSAIEGQETTNEELQSANEEL
jgi:two-component system, chemotaxis family, CheB/CheR fusion protein